MFVLKLFIILSLFKKYLKTLLIINFITNIYLFILCDNFETLSISKRFNMGRAVNEYPYNHSFTFKKEIVATDVKECSKIGWKMLHLNGTAIDAAVASLLCLGIINPHSSGIGGGGFMLVHFPHKNKTEMLDFREEAPECIKPNMIDNENDIFTGGLSVAVPGELKGMEIAWKKYGKLPWKTLFEPSIKLAKKGFKVSSSLAIALDKWRPNILKDETLKNFFTYKGKLIEEGQILKNPKLANLLTIIANANSSAPFYKGKIAQDIENEVNEYDGCIKKEDLENYKVIKRNPISFKMLNYDVITGSAPTSGPILALILKIFQQSNMTKKELKTNPVLVYHHIIESIKYAYGQRPLFSDPNFNILANQVTDEILNSKLSNKLFNQIGYKVHNVSHYLVNGSIPLKLGTTHFVILDKWGNCVSLTSTINGYFGAKFMSKKYGFIYNNEMDDFSFPNIYNEYNFPPSISNYPSKGKRPQSSSTPVIIIDEHNQVVFAAGGSGGSMITSAVAQVIINHFFFGFSLKNSIDSPRLHNQLTPNIVYAEQQFPQSFLTELSRFGHKSEKNKIHHAVVQAISRKGENEFLYTHTKKVKVHKVKEIMYGESDYRKGGEPYGI